MGNFVIFAALSGFVDLGWWSSVLMAALGLGAVIFVHELGHFAVAKWCGVRCDKFYLGFDIYGLKLFKYTWGETEYGIGILPLGGYVKMHGQDDNPSNQADEYERAQTTGIDPRSYLAKSVPQRMAIISAGVIMNLIFAFIFSVWAYSLGVKYIPCLITSVAPGDPAWLADLRPGDEIVKINGIEKPRFDQDLMQRVTLANLADGVTFVVQRPGESETLTKVVKPRHNATQKRPTVGLGSPNSLVTGATPLAKILDDAFHQAEPPFESGDRITHIAGVAVKTFAEFESQHVTHAREVVDVVVERTDKNAGKPGEKSETRQLTIKLPPQPTKRLGLVMEMLPIGAVQENSPASKAGIKPDDRLVSIDSQPVGDPLTLGERLRRLGNKTVKLGIERGKESFSFDVPLRAATWYERPLGARGLMSSPSLGIAYGVGNKVVAVESGSAADRAGIKPGAEINTAEFVYDVDTEKKTAELELDPVKVIFTGEEPVRWFWERRAARLDPKRYDWPTFEAVVVQNLFKNGKIRLTTNDRGSFELTPDKSAEWFEVDRGLVSGLEMRTRQAESFGEALALGARETKEDVLLVYRFLQKLSSGQVSPLLMRGVLTIGRVAYDRASSGFPQLLVFLAVLSANLAVVNFLPIPVLDGGHMVFLALEGLRGKPVSERVVVAFHWAGLCFILGLMVFVIGLDVGDLWR